MIPDRRHRRCPWQYPEARPGETPVKCARCARHLFEVLRPTILICTDFLASTGITCCLTGIGIIPEHKGRPRRSAEGRLTVGAGETGTFAGQAIDIGGLADFIAVTTQRSRSQVIRNNKEHIVFFLGVLKADQRQDQNGKQSERHQN